MHPYIPFLLDDIKEAELEGDSCKAYLPRFLEQEMGVAEPWVSGNPPRHTFGYYCGLKKEQFPPAEQLTVADMKRVFRAFEHLLFSWNADIELPIDLPWRLRYQFIIHTLEERFALPTEGLLVFDYCTGYAPDCIFGKYCECRKYWNEAEGS